MKIPTPHIGSKLGEIAKTVLMPGDPLRAKFIADNFLEDVVKINTVRNMFGYTGTYKGKQISVMSSGMGMPSMGIYSYELFNFYHVDNIIRIGSAGSLDENVKLRDVVIGLGASTDSNYANQYCLPGTFAPIASYNLVNDAVRVAREKNINVVVGNILSTDVFYSDDKTALNKWKDMGILAVEMEAAALYMNAAKAGKNALCLLTISDCPLTGQALSAQDRQLSFTEMMEIALEIVK